MSAPTVSLAPLGGWTRFVHVEHVWGTVVTFDVRLDPSRADADKEARDAVVDAVAFLHDVDAWFSTYRVDTPVTALRNGLLELSDMPPVVSSVLDDCSRLRVLTQGVFDPWGVPGGVDPSGYVKGWAADIAADIVVGRGFPHVSVNAAGDVSCRGWQAPDTPWSVGIRHPHHADQVVRSVWAVDEAVATSGCYERGAHILDPRVGRGSTRLDSATVVGPDGGMADALATALVVAGRDGVEWFAELPGWSAYLICDNRAEFFGPAFS